MNKLIFFIILVFLLFTSYIFGYLCGCFLAIILQERNEKKISK